MKIFHYFFLKKDHKELINEVTNTEIDQYAKIGELVKDARIRKNLSIGDLSNLSKIPKSTINAIENNIEDLRPEFPFLRSILFKLEECLSLKRNILVGLDKKRKYLLKKKINRNYIINRLDLINSWQGSIFYFLLLILTLFILNRYFVSNIRIIEIKASEEKVIEK